MHYQHIEASKTQNFDTTQVGAVVAPDSHVPHECHPEGTEALKGSQNLYKYDVAIFLHQSIACSVLNNIG